MQNRELQKQYAAIKKLIEDTSVFTHDDMELQGHWGRYLCVLVSGFLENAISEIYLDFVERSASPHVAQFARKSLSRISNPKAKKFIETAYQFKKEWGEELEGWFSSDTSRKDAIDSIMANRHLIAHGKQCNISVHRVSEYLLKGVDVIVFLENQCANRPRP